MTHPRRPAALTWALYLNAVLLATLVALFWGKFGEPRAAQAQPIAPVAIAGGAGLFLMPAQFAQNRFGLYIMDVDAGSVAAYEYEAGERQLRLTAVRDINFDRQLRQYNTFPLPREVENLVRMERDRDRQDQPPDQPRPIAP